MNRSFLSSQIILALPSKGEGGDKKETKLLGNRKKRDGSKRDLQPAVPTPLSLSLSLSPSTSPLYITLQRHFFVPTFSFFFSILVRAVCTLRLFAFGVARTTCVHAPALHFQFVSVSSLSLSLVSSLSLYLSLFLSLTLLFFFFLKSKRKEKKRKEKDRKKKKKE